MRCFERWFRFLILLLTGMVVWSVWAAAQTNVTVEFTQRTFTAAENSGVALITLRRNGPTNAAVSVVVTASPGTASPDEFAAPSAPVQFAPGQTEQTAEVRVIDDLVEDGNKTVRLGFGEITGATSGAISSAELVITDNEA